MNFSKHVLTAITSPHTIPALASLAIDDLRGLDFLRNVEPESVGLDPELAFHYSPTSKRWLGALLRDLSISNEDEIVDIGCGKGAAMRIMLNYPFRCVAGVEISTKMAKIARHNFERLHIPEGRVRIFNADAGDFDGLDRFNHIYLFNPFPPKIFARFFDKVTDSMVRHPRLLTIIYNNPTCDDQIAGSGHFKKILEMQADWGNPMFVYESR